MKDILYNEIFNLKISNYVLADGVVEEFSKQGCHMLAKTVTHKTLNSNLNETSIQ